MAQDGMSCSGGCPGAGWALAPPGMSPADCARLHLHFLHLFAKKPGQTSGFTESWLTKRCKPPILTGIFLR